MTGLLRDTKTSGKFNNGGKKLNSRQIALFRRPRLFHKEIQFKKYYSLSLSVSLSLSHFLSLSLPVGMDP